MRSCKCGEGRFIGGRGRGEGTMGYLCEDREKDCKCCEGNGRPGLTANMIVATLMIVWLLETYFDSNKGPCKNIHHLT